MAVFVTRMIGNIVFAGSAEPLDDDQGFRSRGMSPACVKPFSPISGGSGIIMCRHASGSELSITVLDHRSGA